MELGLKGKKALITGGSKGIGLATAVRLILEGADVAICARSKEGLDEADAIIRERTGRGALLIQADVSTREGCERAVAETVQAYGGLDILINNAGTSAARPFEDISPEEWAGDLDLKLHAAINCSRAAIPHMKRAGGGAIVNVTASRAKTPGASSMPSSVSRAAGMALTKAMSKDLGPYGIRVNTVCIGTIRSAQVERMWKAQARGECHRISSLGGGLLCYRHFGEHRRRTSGGPVIAWIMRPGALRHQAAMPFQGSAVWWRFLSFFA